jgi:hypothetical protein
MARTRKERKIDPATGKEVRAPRVPLTQAQKDVVIAERIKLGKILSDESLPDTVVGEASKLLALGTTQLLRRIEKASA